jgi:hypothetical protein
MKYKLAEAAIDKFLGESDMDLEQILNSCGIPEDDYETGDAGDTYIYSKDKSKLEKAARLIKQQRDWNVKKTTIEPFEDGEYILTVDAMIADD